MNIPRRRARRTGTVRVLDRVGRQAHVEAVGRTRRNRYVHRLITCGSTARQVDVTRCNLRPRSCRLRGVVTRRVVNNLCNSRQAGVTRARTLCKARDGQWRAGRVDDVEHVTV